MKATVEPHDHPGGLFGPGSHYAVSMPWRMLLAELTNRDDFDMFSGATPLILQNECVVCWQKMAQIFLSMIVGSISDAADDRAAYIADVERMVAHYIALGETLQ